MLTDILEIQDYADTVTAAANVLGGKRFTVKYVKDAIPHTQIKGPKSIEIVLPMLSASLTEDDIVRHKHHVIHEILHHTIGHDAWDVWAKHKIPNDIADPLSGLCNATEDYRIENLGAKTYLGDGIILSEGTNLDMGLVTQLISNAEKMGRAAADPSNAAFVATMISDLIARCEHNHFPNERDFLERVQKLPQEIQDKLNALDSIDYRKRLHSLATAEESTQLAKDAFKVMFDKDPDEHAKEQAAKQKGKGKGEGKGKGQGKGEGQGNEGQGQDGENGDSSGQGKGEGKNGNASKAIKDNSNIVGSIVDYDDLAIKPHDGPGLGSGNNLKYDKPLRAERSFTPTPKNEIRLRDYTKNFNDAVGYRYRVSEDQKQAANALARPFANKVRRLIQARSDTHYIGNQMKGKLNRKALFRVGVPQVGNGDWNMRVFKRKEQADTLDTVIQLLIDCSGSMNNIKLFQAMVAASMLNEAFDKCLHIPVEILGFSERGNRTSIGIMKGFSQRLSAEKLDLHVRHFAENEMSQNSDGEAILYAYHRLIRQSQQRKIMIVLSDGSPASGRGSAITFTKEVIKEIEKNKKVDICAIGIMHMGVTDLYKQHAVVSKVQELPNALIGLLKNKLVSN